jgi:anaerobic magnesium-protoporphyrin IX monomethyl ester cyclase
VYFIDEVFGLGRCKSLLSRLVDERPLQFGCQTRLDLWDESGLDHLARAGCVSVEFGLESPFPEVQSSINKGYQMDGDRILELMVHAKSVIPWVQGDLIRVPGATPDLRSRTEEWRQRAIDRGVWVSEPVELFLYPGSDLHDELLGPLDNGAWSRAMDASRR